MSGLSPDAALLGAACATVGSGLAGYGLGWESARARLESAIAAAVSDSAQLEASVRPAAGGMRCGRIMIERASREVVEAIAHLLGATLPQVVARLADAIDGAGLAMIAGWDV